MILTVHFMCYGREPSKQFQHIAGMFPVYLRGILRALIYPKGKRKPTYRVNNARVTRHKWANLPPLVAVLPQLVIVLLNVLTPFYALLMETCPPKLILSNCVLSGFTIWALSGIILAAFAKNEPAKGEGLSHG
jgi:cellulose synthase (UDP-forming)